jgi:hypothetical protein
MNEVLTMSQVDSKLPDFEMSDYADVDVKAGIIKVFNSEGEELPQVQLNEVFDYIESEQLNIEIHTTNNSHDGNPTHDEDHEYEIHVLEYLKDNFQEVIKAYYLNKLNHGSGN